jgi:hypothetical protein
MKIAGYVFGIANASTETLPVVLIT